MRTSWLVGWVGASAPVFAAFGDLIYDSTVGSSGSGERASCVLPSAPNVSIGDDFALDPALPVSQRVIRKINLAYVVNMNFAVPDCDAIVTLYGTHNAIATGSQLALDNVLYSFRIHVGSFAADPGPRLFTTGLMDITAATGGGVPLPGGTGGYSLRFVAAGTNTILSSPVITPGFSNGTMGAGSNLTNMFYLDGTSVLDGQYTGSERRALVGYDSKLWLQLDNAPAPGVVPILALGGAAACRRRRTSRGACV